MSEEWNDQLEDLRESSVFQPAREGDIHKDQLDLHKRLEDLANGVTSSVKRLNLFLPKKRSLKECLAKYLLLKSNHTSAQSQANTLDTSIAILWSKQTELSGTWGNSYFLGAGANEDKVCSTTWMGIPCAKKEFHGQETEGLFLKEPSILTQLNHPCIVQCICCGNGKERGDRFIAMELMEKNLFNLIMEKNLFNLIGDRNKYFPLPVVLDIIVQIARGMLYLHDQGVAHRDLKPQNVVVNRMTFPYLEDYFCVKLVDFGMSKTSIQFSKSNTISVRGVCITRYRAPEVHPKTNPNGTGKAIWFKADIYSFAITCAHLLSLKTPFGDIKEFNVFFEELNEGLRPEHPMDCPEELVVLLTNCWNTNPPRPSFVVVCLRLEIFRHKILRGFSTLHESLQENKIDFNRMKLILLFMKVYRKTKLILIE